MEIVFLRGIGAADSTMTGLGYRLGTIGIVGDRLRGVIRIRIDRLSRRQSPEVGEIVQIMAWEGGAAATR